ncbi:MAG: prepilin-type N-terminal cleavage/methylation domain-containing protein [Oscillospiraceae bacterium]|jgi:type II secretory pathway pseudopilin PulG|nr:prepilin-type N-terminal cleavage/methylation domain-containing protein [Oscillospiraceae bacterium]
MLSKKRNEGFSLVELIIIIAILAILLAILVPRLSELWHSSARECAYNINSLIAKCKTDSMSMGTTENDGTAAAKEKNEVYIRLYIKNGEIYGDFYRGTPTAATLATSPPLLSTEKLGDNKAEQGLDAATKTLMTTYDGLYISFDRATGKLDTFGNTPAPTSSGIIGDRAITVGKNTITIHGLTGKHEIG